MKSNLVSRFVLALAATIFSASCGGNSDVQNVYQGQAAIHIKIKAVDQFDNPIEAQFYEDAKRIGTGEFELTYLPGQERWITTFNPVGFTGAAPIALHKLQLQEGQTVLAQFTYIGQSGKATNVCAKVVDSQGQTADSDLNINDRHIHYQVGNCLAVDVEEEVNIVAWNNGSMTYAPSVYIPAGKLVPNQKYFYFLRLTKGEKLAYVTTTPYQAEVLVDGESRGWPRGPDDFIQIPLRAKESVLVNFEDLPGHEKPSAILLEAEKIKPEESSTNRFWGLYDPEKNGLVCFTGQGDNGGKSSAKVLLDNKVTLNPGYDVPGCYGLAVSKEHIAEFQRIDSYNDSHDVLTITQDKHVGCTGFFTPHFTLNCSGKYFYTNPDEVLTDFFIKVKFTGPYQANPDYPYQARTAIDGIQQTWWGSYSDVLKAGESKDITFLPVGVMPPSIKSLTIDTGTLSKSNPSYDPQEHAWVYNIKYIPPSGAIETCVKVTNQNGTNISGTVSVHFDASYQVNGPDEDLDCHWLKPEDSHVIVADGVPGYSQAISPIYVPAGKLQESSYFEVPQIPLPTLFNFCIKGIKAEVPLKLNEAPLGWTRIDAPNCVQFDKSRENTVWINGKSRHFSAEDPSIPGTYLEVDYANFLEPRSEVRRKLAQAYPPRHHVRGLCYGHKS